MKDFLGKHPLFTESIDTLLGILSGSFALAAIILVWIKEAFFRKKDKT